MSSDAASDSVCGHKRRHACVKLRSADKQFSVKWINLAALSRKFRIGALSKHLCHRVCPHVKNASHRTPKPHLMPSHCCLGSVFRANSIPSCITAPYFSPVGGSKSLFCCLAINNRRNHHLIKWFSKSIATLINATCLKYNQTLWLQSNSYTIHFDCFLHSVRR